MFLRKNSRAYFAVRPISYQFNPFGYADSAILYEQEGTKVFVTVSLQPGVPKFLRGSRGGWLSAEYVMHPYAGDRVKKQREFAPNGRDFRSIEISRLISRCFRSVVDLAKIGGEKTIHIDCDVLQADGGTRTAAINAASLALMRAEKQWLADRQIRGPVLSTPLVGISAGVVEGKVVLDLDKSEDSKADADFNFIMTLSKKIVEVQGTAEAFPMDWQDFDECREAACSGVDQMIHLFADQVN